MKILIMHLSDTHISNDAFTKDEFVLPITNTVNEMPSFDKAVIVFSGDIAFSGKKHEYVHARRFIGKVITQLRQHLGDEEKVDVIMVPGNHDLDFKGKQRARADITQLKKEGKLNQMIHADLENMKCFFDLANFNGSFITDRLVDKITLDYNNYKMEFNLINSAPCSALNDPTGDDEHALHHLEPTQISALAKTDKSSVCFTVMHHGLDWFDYESRQLLEDRIANDSSILFVGHDHIQHSIFNSIDGTQSCLVMRGGTISQDGQKSKFNYVLFDTDKNAFSTYCCESIDGQVYCVQKQQGEVVIPRAYSRKGLHLDKDFLDELCFDSFNKTQSQNIFVFPSLSYHVDDESEDEIIDTVEGFMDRVSSAKICFIEGADLSGKTQLLKYLYLSFFDIKIPLYIDANEINYRAKIPVLLHNAFLRQYSKDARDYSRYEQLPSEDKVLFVDNLHRIKDQDGFLSQIKEKYSLIICTTEDKQNKDIKTLVKNNLEDRMEIMRLKLEAFLYKKRSELLEKTYRLLYPTVSEKVLREKVKEINTFINDNLKLFNISPYFIISYCKNYAQNAESGKKQIVAVGEVFYANLVKSFEDISEIRTDTAFFILNKIGFYIMEEKRYPLPVNEFNTILLQYNEEYGQTINASLFLEDLVKAKILRYSGTSDVEFCSLNILAFFAGKCISDKRDTEEGRALIQWLVKNVCFGINSEVLKFITAFNNDIGLLNMLIEEIEKYYTELEALDFDKGNLDYVFRPITAIPLTKPTKETREKRDRTIEETEREKVNSVEIINIFDFSDRDLELYVNKTSRLCILSLLSASLYAQFYHIIPAAQKKLYLDAIFSYPAKTVYGILKPIDQDYDQFISDLYREFSMVDPTVTKERVEKLITNLSELMVFSIYGTVARSSATKETIASIKQRSDEDATTSARLLLMMAYESMGQLSLMGAEASDLYDHNRYDIVRDLAKYTVYHYFVCNQYESHGYAEGLAAKFFGSDSKTMKRIRNKTIKKK